MSSGSPATSFPVITSVTQEPSLLNPTTISGTLNSTPSQNFTVQCFLADHGSSLAAVCGGGASIALLHVTAINPLLELAAIEPGEVEIVGRVVSPPVPTKIGYRADVRVEHLWYEEKEVLRGGGIQVYSGDMPVGVGDRVQISGELKRPETKEDGFDYGRYLEDRGGV